MPFSWQVFCNKAGNYTIKTVYMTKKRTALFNLTLSGLILFFLFVGTSFVSAQSGNGIWGLDISHHQGSINWKQIADKEPDFIYFKATEGSTHSDATYEDNRVQARKHGIVSGAYHFFSFTSPGIRQALHFVKTAKLRKGDLPPVLDIEWIRPMPSISAVVREVTTFLTTVEKEIGVRPVIYTDCMLFNQYLKSGLPKEYELWIASYQSKPACDCIFWQKSNSYRINGIQGNVDYNVFMGSKSQFKAIRMD
jgi:lysozyme